MKNMTAITILMSAILIILIFVQMHNSMRIEERRQEMEELFDKSNHMISKFDSVFGEMAETNKSYSAVINRIAELRKENNSLSEKNDSLNRENRVLNFDNQNLRSVNRKLTQKKAVLNEKNEQYEKAIANYKEEACVLIDSIEDLKREKTGLEILIQSLPAEELPLLSKPLSNLGLKKNLLDKLKSNGITSIGDLVKHSESSLMLSPNITHHALDSINTALATNNLYLDMEITNIDGRWYRLIHSKTENSISTEKTME